MANSVSSASGQAASVGSRAGAPLSPGALVVWPLVVLAAALPFISNLGGGLVSNFTFLQLSLVVVYSIAVLGLNLLTGFNGQISLGHGAFFAVGAYVAAILIKHFDLPWWSVLPAAALACFVAGYLFGLPSLRLEGHYLALATFALAIAVPQILKYRHFEGWTNGVQGITLRRVRAPEWTGLSTDQWLFLVVLLIAVLMFWLARNIIDSRVGRAMMAIRDHHLAADTMGIDTARTKAITFGISALYTGVAGALHAIIFKFVSPDSFPFPLSISFLVGGVVGGIASLPGAVIGGAFVQVIEKYADALTRAVSHMVHLPIELQPWTIYGIVLIILIYVMPAGIAGGIASLWARLRRR
jgi:branched-chain amino acid transport system permease protein